MQALLRWRAGGGWRLCTSMASPAAETQGLYNFQPVSFGELESALASKAFAKEETRVELRGRCLVGTLAREAGMPKPKQGLLVTSTLKEARRSDASNFFLVINNVALPSTRIEEARMWYPKGATVTIKHPQAVWTPSRKVVIEVENPLFIDYSGFELPESCTSEDAFEEANDALKHKEFIRAACLYTRCLADESFQSSHLRVQAFRGRAEAWHGTGYQDAALRDVQKALEIDEDDSNSMLVKGRILLALGSYGEALRSFQEADAEVALQKRCADILEQQRHTRFDFTSFYTMGELSEQSDYMGPIAFDRATDNKGRGVFATEDMKAGKVIAVWNAAVVGKRVEMKTRLVHAFLRSHKTLFQCMSLWSEALPEVELFRPGSIILEQEDKCGIWFDVLPTIDKLCSSYAFRSDEGNGDSDGEMAVWTLPALLNHSCAPNVSQQVMGSVVVLRAARHVSAGDELCITYMDVKAPVYTRKKLTKERWDFVCKCVRCKIESKLLKQNPELATLGQRMSSLVQALQGKSANESLYELCRVSCDVEKEIAGMASEAQRHWMRTSFYDAYAAYVFNGELFRNSMLRPPLLPVKMMEVLHTTCPGYGAIGDMLTLFNIESSPEGEHYDRMKQLIFDECTSIFGSDIQPEARDHFVKGMIAGHGLDIEL